ncbi:MAG TPA: hypothetical protein VNQ90_11415 [Chthoniobacteraceae bacterium]|nr:hypothetical protein [Chthoniobacteraceae bacterium]
MKRFGRTLLKVIGMAAAVVVLLIVAVLLTLYFAFLPSRDVVRRLPSPSGKWVATVVEINGGATTSFGYEVRVARAGWNLGGSRRALLYAAVRSEKAYGVNLRWAAEKELLVEYLDARWTEVQPSGWFGSETRVTLRPGVSDPSAPPGGMLYNLQKGGQEGGLL